MQVLRNLATTPALRWLALLLLCAAYLQGAFVKATDFASAIAEMQHFGLAPAAPLAVLVIAFEFGASLMILTGFHRWLGALGLAGFTLIATFVANRFWEMAPPDRFMAANAFFEHWGLVGGFLLVAWHDLRAQDERTEVQRTEVSI
ncbi:DoxX family protein [Variovorax saccharolyticus]|uniref:DoxX family protein n=1 Tax=Variovorax saccharolyticus TaxID=3053516 RepID=UPI0025771929|nr:DoxX family protein [Variovorax sp. J31P216]MDM0029402.1 DoxX family protein [Variovorax sp. J31P216]